MSLAVLPVIPEAACAFLRNSLCCLTGPRSNSEINNRWDSGKNPFYWALYPEVSRWGILDEVSSYEALKDPSFLLKSQWPFSVLDSIDDVLGDLLGDESKCPFPRTP